MMADCLTRGMSSGKEIASVCKAHPFAVNKHLKNKQILIKKKEKIIQLFHDVLEIDNGIKSGKLPDTGYWIELKKAIHRLHS